MRRLPAIAALDLVYCLAVGSGHPLDILTGGAVGALALWGLNVGGGSLPLGETARRAVAFPALAMAVTREVIAGTVQVARVVLGLRPGSLAGTVWIPIEERSRTGVAVAALWLTLSPGEVLLAVDWERRRMLIHTIDASDPEALRARHRRLYERFQRRVFP